MTTPLTHKPTITWETALSRNFVSYLRVSTQRQGTSGLGLEAQRDAVAAYVASIGGTHVAEFVEVESGRLKARPVLVRSIAQCRREKAVLIIAKLDRLSRNVAFISSLMESQVEFLAVDAPYANRLMLHILAAFAEHERNEISARTKLALAAAKARGVVLGRHGSVLAAHNREQALQFAETVRPHFERLLPIAGRNLTRLTTLLNENGIAARGNGEWHPMSVYRVLNRLNLR